MGEDKRSHASACFERKGREVLQEGAVGRMSRQRFQGATVLDRQGVGDGTANSQWEKRPGKPQRCVRSGGPTPTFVYSVSASAVHRRQAGWRHC